MRLSRLSDRQLKRLLAKGEVRFALNTFDADKISYAIKLVRDLQKEVNLFMQNKLFEQVISSARTMEDDELGKKLEAIANDLYRPRKTFDSALSKFVINAEKLLKDSRRR